MEIKLCGTKQAADAVGMSRSSVISWADSGLFQTLKTPGGHRKIVVEDFLSFLEKRGIPYDNDIFKVS